MFELIASLFRTLNKLVRSVENISDVAVVHSSAMRTEAMIEFQSITDGLNDDQKAALEEASVAFDAKYGAPKQRVSATPAAPAPKLNS